MGFAAGRLCKKKNSTAAPKELDQENNNRGAVSSREGLDNSAKKESKIESAKVM